MVLEISKNSEEYHECIILAGGDAWRLKPDIWVPKPMLQLGKWTLLEYQLKWLIQHKFVHIIVTSDQEYEIRDSLKQFVEWNIEEYKKGTGGAVMTAADKLKTDYFYLMNVDDICFYNPLELMIDKPRARIVISKPRFGFGIVELRQELVIGFKEKPLFDKYVSAGHYTFKKSIVDQYFPDNGNLEELVLPRLARERILENFRLSSKWMSINTMKDYMNAKDFLESQDNL